jgi:hypothetical protein
MTTVYGFIFIKGHPSQFLSSTVLMPSCVGTYLIGSSKIVRREAERRRKPALSPFGLLSRRRLEAEVIPDAAINSVINF